ncbi:MAG: tRNA (adenosine(37)-N6)-threonylcarbamoyltransferase complex ATPase subunit type 1 TsaE [Candidatus Komeilibacteria bacterium]|jgi:tRNA threonylcarbamoyladenosine biosynthesis protein TsaE|nr:tRNA (adenosine(37)-N6)-threonylcarbamoyltransferase complex ATPase subunit type 1 TsaE [Candidatus Komeilibacteria bacterium]
MKEYISNNQAETEKIATELAKELKGGELLALSGNLGAGKTVFVKALGKALGVEENITSPTFVLMKVYNIEYERADKFVHVDCYRLSIQEDLFEIGLGDYLNYDNIIVAIEWADKIANLPDTAIKIHIELIKDDKRKITII